MIKKYSTSLLVTSIIVCSSFVLLGIIHFSQVNPIIRFEHFYFLFGIIGSIATALTLIFLVVQTNQAQKEKRQIEKISQAKMVSAWLDIKHQEVGTGKFKTSREIIMISNRSDLPIFNVVLSIVDGRNSDADGITTPKEFQKCIHVIPPGNWFIAAPIGYNGMGFVGAIEIGFEDSSNRSWIRRGNGSLEEIRSEIMKRYKVDLPPSYDIVQRIQ